MNEKKRATPHPQMPIYHVRTEVISSNAKALIQLGQSVRKPWTVLGIRPHDKLDETYIVDFVMEVAP